ncbi:MAG: hypothetical protein V4608_10545 [Bacteroidota bacterium]
MKQFIYISFLLVCIGASSCVKEKQFPPQPVIKFEKFTAYGNDSADCIITFQDGDGDIGILPGDAISPDDLKMKYLYKGPGNVFMPVDSSFGTTQFDTLFYSYRVPNITPDGQYKALDGEIKIKLRTAPLFGPHTVVKFEIVLKDRAGNKSNMVTTNEILVTP